MSRTYVRTPSGGIRYVPSGPRGTDRVPGILRTLTPTVLPVDIEPCRSAPVGRVLTHRVDPTVQVIRRRYRAEHHRDATIERTQLRAVVEFRAHAEKICRDRRKVADLIRLLGPTNAAWALQVHVEDLADLAGAR